MRPSEGWGRPRGHTFTWADISGLSPRGAHTFNCLRGTRGPHPSRPTCPPMHKQLLTQARAQPYAHLNTSSWSVSPPASPNDPRPPPGLQPRLRDTITDRTWHSKHLLCHTPVPWGPATEHQSWALGPEARAASQSRPCAAPERAREQTERAREWWRRIGRAGEGKDSPSC